MSVFRIQKSKNYTAMSNYHLQDMNLSLKAIGLLSKMLSLPDNWDYSQAGLAAICKDGEASIRSALQELEKCGYLVRERTRDANGRMSSVEYCVYEIPKKVLEDNHGEIPDFKKRNYKTQKTKSRGTPERTLPQVENPLVVNPPVAEPFVAKPLAECPTMDNPQVDTPQLGNEGQYNIYQTKTNKKNTYESIYQSENSNENLKDREMDINSIITASRLDREISTLKDRINYDFLADRMAQLLDQLEMGELSLDEFEQQAKKYNLHNIDRVLKAIAEFKLSSNQAPVKIRGDWVDRNLIKERLSKITQKQVVDATKILSEYDVKSPMYIIAVLYQSSSVTEGVY